MIISAEILEDLEKLDPSTRGIFIKLFREIEKAIGEVVTRKDFIELREEVKALTKAVQELIEAQKRTDERIKELAEAQKQTEERVRELAEAQKRTDEKIKELAEAQRQTDERIRELTEAQRRTDEKIKELVEAQKQTEEKVRELTEKIKELAEAQRQTDEKIKELAEAQKLTEENLSKLVEEHKKTREQLGGLSHTVGYILEDRAYKYLPKLLKEDFGIELENGLKRDYVEVSPKRYEEVNIIGKGKVKGREIIILGEAKTQLKKSDIDNFLAKVNRITPLLGYKDKLILFVTYQASPPVREYAKQKGVAVYFSYQFDI